MAFPFKEFAEGVRDAAGSIRALRTCTATGIIIVVPHALLVPIACIVVGVLTERAAFATNLLGINLVAAVVGCFALGWLVQLGASESASLARRVPHAVTIRPALRLREVQDLTAILAFIL